MGRSAFIQGRIAPAGSRACRNRFLELVAKGAAHGQFRAVAQEDDVIAMEDRLHFANSFEIDNGGAMDAHEPPWVQLLLERRQRLAQKINLLTDVKPYVVGCGFDPVDVVDANEIDASARLDGQSFLRVRSRWHVLQD